MVLLKASEVRAASFAQHANVLAAANRLAERVRSELTAESVLLFGSRARNDWLADSDCDMIVVSDAFAGLPFGDRWNAINDRWDGPVDLEPIGVTPAEFAVARDGGGIVAMALADGARELLPVDGGGAHASTVVSPSGTTLT